MSQAASLIRNWKARRSGGRITVTGQLPGGGAIKVANVDEITLGEAGLIALDKDGAQWPLSTALVPGAAR